MRKVEIINCVVICNISHQLVVLPDQYVKVEEE